MKPTRVLSSVESRGVLPWRQGGGALRCPHEERGSAGAAGAGTPAPHVSVQAHGVRGLQPPGRCSARRPAHRCAPAQPPGRPTPVLGGGPGRERGPRHPARQPRTRRGQGENAIILPPRRPSRRKRDFWLLFIGGNLLAAATVGGLHKNVVTVVFGFSAMVFFSLGLIWVMWFVMDDY